MLLNKIKVLDKGFVTLLESSNTGVKLREVKNELFKAQLHPDFLKLATATIYVKCPLFVQLNFSRFGLTIINVPPAEDKAEAYVPDMSEIGSPNREMNKVISDDMYRTTEALLINPLAYQSDGCNRSVSQVMTPISAYTELIVHGTLEQWLPYTLQTELPKPALPYLLAIEGILLSEWDNLRDLKDLAAKRFQ